MKRLDKGRAAAGMACEGGYEALQSMLKGEYTEESTGARTIRQTGGKDRHSKVFTARGPRDRRVRLSVATAIRFYDLQDRLGFEQPSKAVEWLLLHCQPSIQALPQLASLHPVRVAAIPQPACLDHHPHDHQQQTCKDEHSIHHQKQQKSFLDAGMDQNREHSIYQYNYTAHHHPSLHNISPFPLCTTDSHLQDSIEEDPSQYSNPSSSGASSDHPISFSEASQPHCKAALTDTIPMMVNHAASSAASMRQCSTSFASPAIVHTNKRHRMQLHHVQNQDGLARFASSGTSAANMSVPAGRSLGMITNGLSSPMSSSSFGNTAKFNSLMINDEDASMLMSNSIQGQLNEDSMQHIMALSSLANYKPNQYADMAQQLFSAQAANQLANDGHHNIAVSIQGACNVQANRELGADMHNQACTHNCTSSTMHDNLQLYNKIALQQVDELACSNMYASPSPSESTSINTLAAAYNNSKAGHGNNANNTMVDDQAASILYRPNWNPSSCL